jgi:hypothetical protein
VCALKRTRRSGKLAIQETGYEGVTEAVFLLCESLLSHEMQRGNDARMLYSAPVELVRNPIQHVEPYKRHDGFTEADRHHEPQTRTR